MSETAIEALKWKSPKGIIEPPKPTRIDIGTGRYGQRMTSAGRRTHRRASATLSILTEPAMLDGVRRVRIGRYGHAVLRGAAAWRRKDAPGDRADRGHL
jgi:hypothetical protein